MQFDRLPLEGRRVSLDLNILVQQTVDRLLCFVELCFQGGLCVQLELLLDRFCQIPAEEDQCIPAVAFRVQKPPSGLVVVRQNRIVFVVAQCAPSKFWPEGLWPILSMPGLAVRQHQIKRDYGHNRKVHRGARNQAVHKPFAAPASL